MEDCQKSQKHDECENMILGIEFGTTRIKAVLIDQNHEPIVSANHEWENQYVNDFWTYITESIWGGLQDCYLKLADAFNQKFHNPLTIISAIGFSAMMHGYMPFGKDGDLLVPFRTWRYTNTGEAAEQLTELFKFNIPQRWSIAHLYQVILNGEAHVSKISYLTTLAGYVHWQLTGKKILGIGDASGMFPIDGSQSYDQHMIESFNQKVAENHYPWKFQEILPELIMAGQPAGFLSEEGARLIDPSGHLRAGIPFCPPEGDAGTGMVATNSVAEETGNISAGTSIFAMIVLKNKISKVYRRLISSARQPANPWRWFRAIIAPPTSTPGLTYFMNSRAPSARGLVNPRYLRNFSKKRWKGKPTAGTCSPIIIFLVSQLRVWKKNSPCLCACPIADFH